MRTLIVGIICAVCLLGFTGCRSTWPSKIENIEDRFNVLDDWSNEVVRDNETGLLWERYVLSPGSNPDGSTGRIQRMSWSDAVMYCYRNTLGNADDNGLDGRAGWRLPAIEELTSLLRGDFDQWESEIIGILQTDWGFAITRPRNPDFPDSNNPRTYWSITTSPSANTDALVLEWIDRSPAGDGVENLFFRVNSMPMSNRALPWCVRGGIGHNPGPAGG